MQNGTRIHKTAIIYPGVDFGENCKIGEYVIIGRNNLNRDSLGSCKSKTANTLIGDNTVIDAYSYISQGTERGLCDIGAKYIYWEIYANRR